MGLECSHRQAQMQQGRTIESDAEFTVRVYMSGEKTGTSSNRPATTTVTVTDVFFGGDPKSVAVISSSNISKLSKSSGLIATNTPDWL